MYIYLDQASFLYNHNVQPPYYLMPVLNAVNKASLFLPFNMPVLTVPELELDSVSSLSVSMIFLNASSKRHCMDSIFKSV